MSVSLLSTKFYIPPPREDVVARPRLTEKVLAGVNRPQTFTLLSGPAGSGKTTLLSQFVTHFRRPVAWLSLDEADDDPIRFWTYLLTACQSVLDGVGESAQALLETAQSLPDDTVPTLLINDLAGQEAALVLLLDDFHVIHDPSIHAGFSFLLDHLPGNLHVVASTRVDPPWPLSRYRARNQLVEIRARDLRFSREEAAEFLRRTTDLNLSAEDVAALEARTEGWAAGLQLAAIAMQTPQSSGLPHSPGLPPSRWEGIEDSDASAFVKAFTGSQLYVAEYLVEEVLRRQPEGVQTFLLQTSILSRLKAGLCDAVTGRRDGREMLDTLHRANLFLVPLDAVGHWFRYHHLFADLLQARLRQTSPSEAIAALHLRAADWYERNGFDTEAVDHALEANDLERVASLVDRAGQRLIFTDQYATLKSWLDVLPPESFQTHPRLEIYRVLLALTKGTLDMSEQTLVEKEQLIKALPPSPQNDRLRVEAMVYLALFLAFQNASRAIQIAQEALLEIPEDALKRRAYLFSALYRAHGMAGDVDKAERAYVESLRLAQAAGHYGMASNTTMIRAFDLCQYGRLDEALSYCQLIVDAGSRLQRKVFHDAGQAYIGLAGIHLERYHVQTAEDYLQQGMELCRQGGMYGLFTAYVQKARLHQAKGEFEEALAELRALEETLQRREFTLMTRQVSLRLAMGDVDTASGWVAPLLEMLGESPYARKLPLIAVEAFKLSLARIYLAQGEIEQANQVLDQIQATVEPGKRFGRLMEVHLLRALALQKREAGDISSQAIAHLERALDLAQPAGFVLLLVEEGTSLISLLQAVTNRRSTPARLKQYAQKLLNAFSGYGQSAASQVPAEAAGLVETLTPREMEVLQLIAAGHSNQAIADRLFITVRTVKKHAGNIYSKLKVSRRTEAVARARELGLLPTEG